MKIKNIELYKIKIPLKNFVAHNLGRYIFSEALIVRVETDEGITGWGEARPREYLTGETFESLRLSIDHFALSYLAGKEFFTFHEVWEYLKENIPVPRSMLSAYCGLELAVLDLAGKIYDIHLSDIISKNKVNAYSEAANIGYQTKTNDLRKICMAIKLGGYPVAKIKAGLKDDLERIRIVRKHLGNDFFLWIDVNAAWDYDNALDMIGQIKKFNINVFEQPLPAGDLVNMARLRKNANIRIIADESLCSFKDAVRLVKAFACDFFNIRIGKCGGLQKALELIAFATENNMEYIIGSLVAETGVLLQPLKLLINGISRPIIVDGLRQNRTLLKDDIIACDSPYGLGISINEERLVKYTNKITAIRL
jgi:L-alanine-DL-glutamate epimerase-like enolase superfamily enzyme